MTTGQQGVGTTSEPLRCGCGASTNPQLDVALREAIAAARGDHSSLGGWKKAYRAVVEGDTGGIPAGVSPLPVPPPWQEVVHGEWSRDRVLPWEHLEGPLPKATLVGHRQQALGG